MVITDLRLDTYGACLATKSVHLPHEEGRGCASEYLEQVHIDVVGSISARSAGGKEYVYVVVNHHTKAITRGLCGSRQRLSALSRRSDL
jgi:hypothetical protein